MLNPRHYARARADDSHLLGCQEAIGYLFRREGLLRKALTHSSVKNERNPSNERLEFLGDAILGMVISEYLFSMLPENDEGDLTKIKSVVVSTLTLARLGLELGLDEFLLTGKGIRMQSKVPRSLVANMVEAIIAAVYLDRGMEAARHFVLDHLHRYVEEVLTDSHEEKNYKSLLQQRAQRMYSCTPVYRVLGERGPDHLKLFRVSAVLGDRTFPIGRGQSKKEAEQAAAKAALENIDSDNGKPSRRGGKKSRKKAARGPVKKPVDPPVERPAKASEERPAKRPAKKQEAKRAKRAKKSAKKPEVKSEAKRASKPEAKRASKPEAKRASKPEAKRASRPEAGRTRKPRAKPEAKPEAPPTGQPAKKPARKSRAKPKAKLETEPEPKPKPARPSKRRSSRGVPKEQTARASDAPAGKKAKSKTDAKAKPARSDEKPASETGRRRRSGGGGARRRRRTSDSGS